jgi:hypothetical protein
MPFPRVLICGLLSFFAAIAFAANDPKPAVGPGATKDEVIAAYGWPNGESRSGSKEILSYAQGEVIMENGRVDRVNFSPNVPWQKPKPKPPPPTASTRKVPEAPVDFWLTDFAAAQAEATRRHARILALFTGSDWSPPSQQFHDEVEYQPEFVNAFAGDFVFLKLDYPRGNPVPAKISEEKVALRDRYGVTTYPTLLILDAMGSLLARADLTKSEAGQSFRDRVIAAVRDAQRSLGDQPDPAPAPAPEPKAVEPVAAPLAPVAPANGGSTNRGGDNTSAAGSAVTPAMLTATEVVLVGLAIGAAVVGFILWRLWRQRKPGASPEEFAERIDAAAGGLPSSSEMASWSHEKLRAVTEALAEFDNYLVYVRPLGAEVGLDLRRRGDPTPRVLVCCAPGSRGIVSAKPLRELFGSLAAEGVETGRFISPAGFTTDARNYAAAHKIVLVGAEGLHNLMREVPPVSLPAILAKSG